ncbi:hypothetical protein ABK040_005298 [Willaertia magna]
MSHKAEKSSSGGGIGSKQTKKTTTTTSSSSGSKDNKPSKHLIKNKRHQQHKGARTNKHFFATGGLSGTGFRRRIQTVNNEDIEDEELLAQIQYEEELKRKKYSKRQLLDNSFRFKDYEEEYNEDEKEETEETKRFRQKSLLERKEKDTFRMITTSTSLTGDSSFGLLDHLDLESNNELNNQLFYLDPLELGKVLKEISLEERLRLNDKEIDEEERKKEFRIVDDGFISLNQLIKDLFVEENSEIVEMEEQMEEEENIENKENDIIVDNNEVKEEHNTITTKVEDKVEDKKNDILDEIIEDNNLQSTIGNVTSTFVNKNIIKQPQLDVNEMDDDTLDDLLNLTNDVKENSTLIGNTSFNSSSSNNNNKIEKEEKKQEEVDDLDKWLDELTA